MKGEIFRMLKRYKSMKRHSFSMPGHKNGKGLKGELAFYDVTELSDTDNLHNSDGACKIASQNIARIYGAELSIIMTNGSTGGIFAMLASTLRRGDEVLVSRLSHISVINACIVLGLKPIFFEHNFYPEYSIYGEADLGDFSKKLDRNLVKAVLVTSPNYNGVVSDIVAISKMTRNKNIPLLVDEAHGAHFIAGEEFPQSAIKLGADMAVTSTHKTLNGLNQSAILNVKSLVVDYERVKTMATFFQTSSPSYPIAASCENAVVEVWEDNLKWMGTLKLCQDLKKFLKGNTRIKIPELSDGFFGIDPARVTLNFSEYKTEGHKIAEMLRKEYNIDVEMSDKENILLILTAGNKKRDYKVLKKALFEICSKIECRDIKTEPIPMPEIRLDINPTDAFYSDGEWAELAKSEGKISKNMVMAYPPGVPVIVTGERITKDAIGFLNSCGGEIIGLKDGFILVKKEGF